MASLSSKNIDDIDDVEDMIEVLRVLGISSKGIASFDLMKARARERLSQLPERPTWSNGQAFSILEEARAEDARKREELLSLFSRANDLLNHQDMRDSRFFQGNREIMQRHTDQLKQESYHLLVAGESGAGKSSLINLILEEKLLPTAMLPTKSPICELKYGKERKIVLHYKEADSKEKKKGRDL